MASVRYWLWLTSLPKLGPRAQMKVYEHFGSPEEAFLADREAIDLVEGLSLREKECLYEKDLKTADTILGDCEEKGISILTYQDAMYPQRLKHIDVPPLVLYYKGRLLPFDDLPAVTVVGARKCSGYGALMAKRLGSEIGQCGGTVISGAAMGIDALALEGALSADAPVAAVLGCGVDVVYPASSRNLYRDILTRGCLLSEYYPGTPPYGQNFPRRNRIMSGLALGVIVVEAGKKSGSLITAEYALEQGRDVFAVPGNAGLESSEGSNALIQEGAMLVTSGWEIMREYQPRFPGQLHQPKSMKKLMLSPKDQRELQEKAAKKSASPERGKKAETEKTFDKKENSNYSDVSKALSGLSEDEGRIVTALNGGEKHIDDIIAETNLSPARVLASLTLLEVKKIVKQTMGKRFHLNQ